MPGALSPAIFIPYRLAGHFAVRPDVPLVLIRPSTMSWAVALVFGISLLRAGGGEFSKHPPTGTSNLVHPASTRLVAIELEDQFGALHHFAFPRTNPVVLLAADRKGYEGLAPWIEASHQRWRERAGIVGVADLRAVPGFVQGKVRRKFRSGQGYPVLLDWDGAVLGRLRPEACVPKAFLLDTRGQGGASPFRQATDSKLAELQDRLGELAAGPTVHGGATPPSIGRELGP